MKFILKFVMMAVLFFQANLALAGEKEDKAEFIQAMKEFKEAWESEDRETAADYAEKAYSLSKRLFKEGSKYQFYATKQYAMALENIGSIDRAALKYEEALRDAEPLFEKTDAQLFDIYFSLSTIHSKSYEYDAARNYLNRAEDIFQINFPDDPLVEAEILNLKATLDLFKGNAQAAEKHYRRVYDIYTNEYGTEHPQTFVPYIHVAKIYMAKKKYEKALEFLEPANKVFSKTLPPRNSILMSSHAFLVETYEKLGEPEKANEHCIAIAKAEPGEKVDSYKPIFKVFPEYPRSMLERKKGGEVILEYTVDETGQVRDIKVLEGDGSFKRAAIDAVEQFRYAPAIRDGKPVASPGVKHKITFEIAD